ncbi:unnamed protein product [Penicillium bialowiezense]
MPPTHLDHLHLNESIQEVGTNSWLVSNTLLLTRSSSPLPGNIPADEACWSDSSGGHFTLSAAPGPLPDSKPLSETSSCITRVHAVDNQAAVWKVLCHFESGSRYFLVVSKVPGQLLHDAWPGMDETSRQYYIDKVADICDYLATWKGDSISGVDGQQLLERYLLKGNTKMADALAPQQLLKNCAQMSMNVSAFVFHHCDLGPTNLLVDVSTGSLSIIDWELAGYVPIEWVRTKFRISAGMDFDYGDEHSKKDWRRQVAQRLGKMGYTDVLSEWWEFQDSS